MRSGCTIDLSTVPCMGIIGKARGNVEGGVSAAMSVRVSMSVSAGASIVRNLGVRSEGAVDTRTATGMGTSTIANDNVKESVSVAISEVLMGCESRCECGCVCGYDYGCVCGYECGFEG